jgi:hypothetical protein
MKTLEKYRKEFSQVANEWFKKQTWLSDSVEFYKSVFTSSFLA